MKNTMLVASAFISLSFAMPSAFAFSTTPLDESKADLSAALNLNLNPYMPANSPLESIQMIGVDAEQNPIYAFKADSCILNIAVMKKAIARGVGSGMFERTAVIMTKSSGCPSGPLTE